MLLFWVSIFPDEDIFTKEIVLWIGFADSLPAEEN